MVVLMSDEDQTADDKSDVAIVKEATKRFKREQTYQSTARTRYVEDTKFANADARNMYQWPDSASSNRMLDGKPCFTINKTRVHNLQIINDARQNKQAIKIDPTGNGATYKSAQICQGIVRHIENQSDAQSVYTSAVRQQVQGGVGYWRVTTEYASDDDAETAFNQEIYIRRIKDALSVYIDSKCAEADRSDAKYAFVFDTMAREDAEEKWPKLKDRFPTDALGALDGWVTEDDVRVAEYFRRVGKPDELVAVEIDGKHAFERMSRLQADPRYKGVKPKFIRQKLVESGAQFRNVTSYSVEWYKIAGDTIVERGDWPGTTIPVVMCVGEETVIDGQMDRKGHTRALIDPQRNLNYWTSEGAAQVALQTKTPYIGPARAFENHEEDWKDANRKNLAFLSYNDIDEDGQPINDARPQRSNPPVMAQAYLQGMQFSEDQMRMVSGQYEATTGEPGNETSGVAIGRRQRQGENATYHYVDHEAMAIRRTGNILIEIMPKVYDTKRVMKIMGDDGKVSEITLDPQAQGAYLEHQKQEENAIKGVFNPTIGKYAVVADVGPSFATQRQEAFNALSQIAQKSPQMMQLIGDLVMKSADFPLADEMAERLHRMVPAQALGGENETPQEQQLKQQLQTMQQLTQAMTQKIAELQGELKSKDDGNSIKAYEAETKRIDSLADYLASDPDALKAFIMQTLRDATALGAPEAAGQPAQPVSMPQQAAPPDTPQPDPGAAPMQQPQPPQLGGFSLPDAQEPQQ